ncbi:MAG: hypothetical protein K0S65_387 [Labilithrix sp.]|nr:hypothetical protein [Labilithrix sp.]
MSVETPVPRRLAHTWIVLAIAMLAVVGSGAVIVQKFIRYVFIECRGTLHTVPLRELGDAPHLQRVEASRSDLAIRFDEKPGRRLFGPKTYSNVHVAWERSDAKCACADVAIPWAKSYPTPSELRLFRDEATGLFLVRESNEGPNLIGFRKIEDRGHRLDRNLIADPHNVSMLVFIVALGALVMATFRAARATPYATQMFRWIPGTLRHDGLVESETGASLGKMDARSRVASGDVIVDPRAIESQDAYRGLSVLTRRNVGSGSHSRWYEGTMRRLRDARALAILAMAGTALAVVARVLGA